MLCAEPQRNLRAVTVIVFVGVVRQCAINRVIERPHNFALRVEISVRQRLHRINDLMIGTPPLLAHDIKRHSVAGVDRPGVETIVIRRQMQTSATFCFMEFVKRALLVRNQVGNNILD